MLKHMLTTDCPRSCEYCITRNVKAKRCDQFRKTEEVYKELKAQGHKEIMLTGGEPTSAPNFYVRAMFAYKHFGRLHMTTQNPRMIDNTHPINDNMFESIMYSLHDGLKDEYIGLKQTKVYGAVLDKQYHPNLPVELMVRGFSGLTINEEQRAGKTFTQELPHFDSFSIRVNRVGHCLDETIILPDLKVITDYREYL